MIDFAGYLWQAIGIGVVVLGIAIAIGAVAWRRRHSDTVTPAVREHATRRLYKAEEQEQERKAATRSRP